MSAERPYTQSELKTFRECRRKWWLGTHRGLRLKAMYQKPGAAWLGSLVHSFLEARDQGQDWTEVLSVSRELAEETYADHPERLKQSLEAHDMAEIIVEGYIQWVEDTGVDQFLETTGVEEKVTVEFGDRTLMGKIDKRARHTETGEEVFIDYKTAGDLTSIPRRAAVDEQFLHYTLLLQLADPSVESVRKGIWRMMVKSKRTDRTLKDDGSTKEFYGEHEYVFNTHQMESYVIRLQSIIKEIERAEQRLEAGEDSRAVAYPTPTGDCWWKCEFYGICPMFDDGSRVESFIEDWYDERDPLERYQDVSTPTESE